MIYYNHNCPTTICLYTTQTCYTSGKTRATDTGRPKDLLRKNQSTGLEGRRIDNCEILKQRARLYRARLRFNLYLRCGARGPEQSFMGQTWRATSDRYGSAIDEGKAEFRGSDGRDLEGDRGEKVRHQVHVYRGVRSLHLSTTFPSFFHLKFPSVHRYTLHPPTFTLRC
jgi:hypothetical protein